MESLSKNIGVILNNFCNEHTLKNYNYKGGSDDENTESDKAKSGTHITS